MCLPKTFFKELSMCFGAEYCLVNSTPQVLLKAGPKLLFKIRISKDFSIPIAHLEEPAKTCPA